MSRRSSILAFLFVMCAPSLVLNATEAGYVPAATPSCTISHLAGNTTGAGYADGTGAAARFSAPSGAAVDSSGNVYIADTWNHVIRKVTPAGLVSTFAGMTGVSGAADGTGSAARFNSPRGIAIDGTGTFYVTDTGNHTIRKMTSGGVVSTLAGSPARSSVTDGTGTAAGFNAPRGIAVDAAGTIYVTEFGRCVIRRISPAGAVTTIAGQSGSCGEVDGTGTAARFMNPVSIVVVSGNLFVADQYGCTIRKIAPGGVVTTVAGLAFTYGMVDAQGSEARFQQPSGLAVSSSGDIYVADWTRIRKLSATGLVTPFAGRAWGSSDGTGSAASFPGDPKGIAFDASGNLYVAEERHHTIRRVTPGAIVTTIAGVAYSSGAADGTGSAALLVGPAGTAVDRDGNAYITDYHAIRKVTPEGVVTTVAGVLASSGSGDSASGSVTFNSPDGIAIDGAGTLYVADTGNQTVRKISGGIVTTLAGSPGSSGSSDGTGGAARFNRPTDVTVDGAGNVYVADNYNHRIRRITPAGVVSTLAGSVWGHADGNGADAMFRNPTAVAADAYGNVFIADSYNYVIRKISPGGDVSTIAGKVREPGAVDGIGADARFTYPTEVAVGPSGIVYVADSGALRKVTSAGEVSTILGISGSFGNVGGTGSAARLGSSFRVAVGPAGKILVADTRNIAIRVAVFSGSAGDVNGDGIVNAADIFHLVNVLYAGWPETTGSDVDGDGLVTIADVFYLINYLFGNGPTPGVVSPAPAVVHLETAPSPTEGEER